MVVLTIRSVLWAVAVAIIFWRGGDMVALAIALALTNAVGSIVQALAARRMLGRWPRPSRGRLSSLVRAGVPLGISVVLITAYANIDQVIVFELAGSRAAGLYGAAYRVLEQAHFVPISVLTTMTPIIAASWPRDRARMLRAAGVTAELMAVASFGALAFVTVAAAPLTRLIFGAGFSAAAPALPVLFGAFVFICFGYLNGNLLTRPGAAARAVGDQRGGARGQRGGEPRVRAARGLHGCGLDDVGDRDRGVRRELEADPEQAGVAAAQGSGESGARCWRRPC